MDITHCLIFYLKDYASETGFCILLQVRPNLLGQIEICFCLDLLAPTDYHPPEDRNRI
jgi:hypothetical protein